MKNILFLLSLLPAFAQSPAPVVVATPPADASRGLIRLSPQEIRHYSGDKAKKIFLQSLDNGKTWNEKIAPDSYPPNFGGLSNESPAISYLPLQKEFLRVQPAGGFIFKTKDLDGQWAAVTKEGKLETDWNNKDKQKNFLQLGGIMRNPTVLQKGKRILIPAHDKAKGTWFHISDDGGLTWKKSKDTIHVDKYPIPPTDSGPRWYNGGVEATVIELKNGKLWSLLRTSHNQHWQSFSSDGGNTWDRATASPFYGTLTMISLARLDDNTLVTTWTNTASLAERAHGRNDAWEDVFTNRDSHHIALSKDEGKTWYGFREIFLGEHRNTDNYGDVGGTDRGSHQSEILDLGKGNILVSLGQHPLHRRMVIVNTTWVAETSRADDFKDGDKNWTTHTYIPIIRGHSAYNRKSSASIVDSPVSLSKKALEVKFLDYPSLIATDKGAADYRSGGATWNFPSTQKGGLLTKIYFNEDSKGINISLCDRLFNACDVQAPEQAAFTLKLAPNTKIGALTLKAKTVYSIVFKWDGNNCSVRIVSPTKAQAQVTLKRQSPSPMGISYIHFITASKAPDTGTLILSVMEKGDLKKK